MYIYLLKNAFYLKICPNDYYPGAVQSCKNWLGNTSIFSNELYSIQNGQISYILGPKFSENPGGRMPTLLTQQHRPCYLYHAHADVFNLNSSQVPVYYGLE